jgi:Flp pilus assembly protein TadG
MKTVIAMRPGSPKRDWEAGAATVEAAIVFAVLFSLIFGIIEFGMALWQWNTMELAILDEGRYAMINNATITAATAESDLQNKLPGATVSCPLPSSPATGTWYVCAAQSSGTPATMSLSAAYGYDIIGLLGPFKAAAQATVPLD